MKDDASIQDHPPVTDPRPRRRLSREEVAAIEVGHTAISRPAARFLAIFFLLLISGVPIGNYCLEYLAWRRGAAGRTGAPRMPWRQRHSAVAAINILPTAARWREAHGWAGLTALNAGMLEEINRFETRLEEESILQRWLIPPTQWVLTGGLRSGNETGYCGRGRWLFYRPGIDLVTGKGFLEEPVLEARRRSGKAWERPPQPDPLPAIVDFRDQLRNFGVELVVLPVPAKPMIEPGRFSKRFEDARGPLRNPSHADFMAALQAAGVHCLDLSDLLFGLKDQLPQGAFLATDTHWTPQAMQACARELARMIGSNVTFAGPREEVACQRHPMTVTRHGDILDMLRLPASQPFYPPQSVVIEQVRLADGTPWRAEAAAEVLLLGDSFANIYALAGMGWGEAAGLAEHLALELGRPVDRIAINDHGAYATRQELATQLRRGNRRLAHKRVVVWEFAARELALGDWRLIELEEPVGRREQPAAATAGAIEVAVRIKALPAPPVPGNVPYRDAVVGMHLEVESVKGGATTDVAAGSELLAYGWVMRANKLTPLARLRAGGRLTMTLVKWESVSERYGSFNRIEPDDPLALMLEPYWIEAHE